MPDGARFCPNCGHLLVETEERRIVSVLFADLVGFTALSEDRDPEQVKHLVDRCFQRLVADITAFGGTVDKIVGDGIVRPVRSATGTRGRRRNAPFEPLSVCSGASLRPKPSRVLT